MRILRSKPLEDDLISLFYTLRFLKALVLTTSVLIPFVISSNNTYAMYLISIQMLLTILFFFHYESKLSATRKIQYIYKQNEKMFKAENVTKELFKQDFFLHFTKEDLRKGNTISFYKGDSLIVKFQVSDLLLNVGDNHFVMLFTEDSIEEVKDFDCILKMHDGSILQRKKLNHLFTLEV